MKTEKLLKILIAVLSVIFLVSLIWLILYYADSSSRQAQDRELAGMVESLRQQTVTGPEDGPQAGTLPAETAFADTILPEYRALYEKNGDLVGWLQIPGTNVNYPVMQTPDRPDFYLTRDFDRQYHARGCLYARETCDVFAPSDNVTIYGHNMNNGTMFHDLTNYLSKAYWQEHATIRFDTLHQRHTYQIFAVFKTTASLGEGFSYHQFENAADQEEFDAFVRVCKHLAFYDTGLTPTWGDKLICLSTCEYTLTNGRLVVVAYRIE